MSLKNSFGAFLKVGTTRRMVAVAYGKRCGEVNLSILEDLVNHFYFLPLIIVLPIRSNEKLKLTFIH